MKNLSIRYKVLLTTLTPTVIISVLLLWMSSENSRDTADAVAQATKEDLYEATKDDTKSRLEMAFNAIQPFYTQSDNTEEAQQKALEVLRSIHYDDGNYIFVYDFDGKTMAYRPDPSTEGTNRIDLQDPTGKPVLKDLIEIAKSGGGFYEYTWKNPKSEQNEPKVSYTLALDKWGWMMGTGTYLGHINKEAEILQNEIFEHSNKTIMLESIVLAVVLFIDFLIALFLARLIATPIQQIAGLVGQVAEGDLKSRVEVTSSDELGQFGETFNQLLDKIQHVIQDVYKSATQLSSSATVLNESSQNTYQAISQQDKETMAISDSVSLMSESARKIAGDGEIVNVSARDAGEKASEAAEAVQGNLSSVQNLAKEISQAAEAVGAVEKRTGEIQSMLEVIHSVTEQTNLLALNAAIEAARAGEQGRGFAVVADEVRSLAMRSSESAEEIRRIIEGLTTDTNSAVATMNASKERSGENLERTQLVASSLGAIDQAVQSILSKSVDIASATDEQNQVAQEIAKNLSSIQDIAATNANEVKNNKESSAQLDSLGNDLLNNINFFKL